MGAGAKPWGQAQNLGGEIFFSCADLQKEIRSSAGEATHFWKLKTAVQKKVFSKQSHQFVRVLGCSPPKKGFRAGTPHFLRLHFSQWNYTTHFFFPS